jgi:23S rRNA (uracil1939-C5)-methyltransferase
MPGELVRMQRRKRRRNYDEAELLEVLESSAARITPRCSAFGDCGGCSLQHMPGEDQRAMKQQTLMDNLQRIGKVEPERWLSPLFDDSPEGSWNYRRRARLAVKDVAAKERVLVGFRERHAPFVCDMQRCEVLQQPVDGMLMALSELVGRLSLRNRLPQIEVAVAEDVTALVFRILEPLTAEDETLLKHFAAEHRVQIAVQSGGPDSVEALTGDEPLTYSLPEFDVRIEFGPTDFVQVNPAVNRMMTSRAVALLAVESGHRVLDLYCGIGNFSLPLARKAGAVLALEGEAHQVRRGRENAARNHITNCEFRQADLSTLTGRENWLKQPWDRVLLDPARSGAECVISHMDRIAAPRIVYVSCHPGTLARDLGTLVHRHGYRLEAAGIIDMFPHTAHVESLAILQKD